MSLTVAIVAGVTLLTIAVGDRWFARSGIGWLAYAAHDALWLPAVGYLWTLYLPWSIALWGTAALATLLWLVYFVRDDAVTRRAHVRLSLEAVRRPVLHPLLLVAAKQLRRVRIDPRLLEAAVAHECTDAIERLTRDPRPNEASDARCDLAVRLCRLRTTLQAMGEDPDRSLVAIADLYEGFVRLRVAGWTRVLPSLAAALQPLLHERLGEASAANEPRDGPFRPATVLADVACLVAAAGPACADAVGVPRHSDLTALGAIATHVEQRRAALLGPPQLLRRAPRHRTVPALALPADHDAALRFTSRIATDVALDLAAHLGSAALAIHYLDALDALAIRAPGRDERFSLVRDVPRRDHYWLAARLLDREVAERAAGVRLLRDAGIVADGDLDAARTRVASLDLAAGPGPGRGSS